MNIDVVIPVLNEEHAIGLVIDEIPRELVRQVIVADNGSTDRSAEVAQKHGARVVRESERGYGAACLKALEYISADPPDVVVFLDGDHSDYPQEMPKLVQAISDADMVIGSRALGESEKGSLTPQQYFGNALACFLMRWIYGSNFSDLGPFRAIRWEALENLQMVDRNYGWTVEMQVKATRQSMRCVEVPVSYRRRIGESKVSGTIRGSINAGAKILYLIGKYSFS